MGEEIKCEDCRRELIYYLIHEEGLEESRILCADCLAKRMEYWLKMGMELPMINRIKIKRI